MNVKDKANSIATELLGKYEVFDSMCSSYKEDWWEVNLEDLTLEIEEILISLEENK